MIVPLSPLPDAGVAVGAAVGADVGADVGLLEAVGAGPDEVNAPVLLLLGGGGGGAANVLGGGAAVEVAVGRGSFMATADAVTEGASLAIGEADAVSDIGTETAPEASVAATAEPSDFAPRMTTSASAGRSTHAAAIAAIAA